MRTRTSWRVVAVLAAAGLGIATTAVADEAVGKYRQSVMQAMGGHTAALAAIIKGEVPFSGNVEDHADAIADLAKMATKVFPAGSALPQGAALPAIWEKPDEFKQVLAGLETAAASLAKKAESDPSPKAVAPAFSDLAKACKACHDSFRKKT
jgi:cytochrome c556